MQAMLPTVTEGEFTAQIIKLARLYRWRVAHFRPARTKDGWRTAVSGNGKGFPDLILIRSPYLVAAELKVGNGKVRAEQEEWLNAFRSIGSCWTFVWRPTDWREIEMVLTQGPVALPKRGTG